VERDEPNYPMRIVVAMVVGVFLMTTYSVYNATAMPSHSYSGAWTPLNHDEVALRDRLQFHVNKLALGIGERNIGDHFDSLEAAANYIEQSLQSYGYMVTSQPYAVRGKTVRNLGVEVAGTNRPDEVLIVGAHYDSVLGTPGANDNASGVAAVLELARLLQHDKPERTVRFVFFVNEEPPYFQTAAMGSLVYAKQLRQQKTNVIGMISIETIGSYSDAAHSQHYPPPLGVLYPTTANFIGFVGDSSSRYLLRHAVKLFRESVKFPSEGVAAPSEGVGIGWSDHWSFWQERYPAIMVTDTAPFRYRYYHHPLDTPDKMDFDRMARVVYGLQGVVRGLAAAERGK